MPHESWSVSERWDGPVLRALFLRDALGVRVPGIPRLRGVRVPATVDPRVERQWGSWWPLVVEPQRHRSSVPLSLVDGYGDLVAMPVAGAEVLREHATALALDAHRYLEGVRAPQRAASPDPQSNRRPEVDAVVQEVERDAGRPARRFALSVHVLPFTQTGLWWIGETTIAVSDRLRTDAAAYRRSLRPVIEQLAG